MLSNKKTLMEAWGEPLSSGVFRLLRDLTNASTRFPWLKTDADSVLLDELYYRNHSGKKLVSNIITSSLNNKGNLPEASKIMLANIIALKYEENWRRLWETMVAEYSPISNYDVTTTRELSKEESEDESLNKATSEENVLTHGLSRSTVYGKTDTTNESTYGFNSAAGTPVPSGKVVDAASGADTTTDSGNDSTQIDRNDDASRLKAFEGAENEEIHKTGVIGTVSVQKLLSEEREVWTWSFYESVFADIDKVLTIAVYDGCR